MRLDIEKNGLAAIFKEWQVPLIEELFRTSLTSRKAYELLAELDVSTTRSRESISRASTINFLNSMVDQGLLDYSDESSRGGYARRYKMVLTREEFAHKIMGMFADKLIEAFPEESPTFPWPNP